MIESSREHKFAMEQVHRRVRLAVQGLIEGGMTGEEALEAHLREMAATRPVTHAQYVEWLALKQVRENLKRYGWRVELATKSDDRYQLGWKWVSSSGSEHFVCGDQEGEPPVPDKIRRLVPAPKVPTRG